MNDALGKYDNVDIFGFNVKQPFSFDHFQSFIHQSSRIDGYFVSHFPIGVLQGFFHSDVFLIHALFFRKKDLPKPLVWFSQPDYQIHLLNIEK
jgi:hypothetical protein